VDEAQTTRWVEIVSADDDMVEQKLIEWAGLDQAWDDNELFSVQDFMPMAECAKNIEMECENWGGETPGRSGVWHRVSTNNPEALKKELRGMVAKLLWKNRRKVLQQKRIYQEAREREWRERKVDPDDPFEGGFCM